MSNLDEQLRNLKSSVFNADATTKAYSLRLPLDLSAHVEVIADVSGKSRNIIMADLLRLGVAYFLDNLEGEEAHIMATQYEEWKDSLYAEAAMGGN
jgi:predicted transcriptional regulator